MRGKHTETALATRSANYAPPANLAGANNMFGTIGTSGNGIGLNYNFIPTDSEGGIMSLNGDGVDGSPRWLGLQSKSMQWMAYKVCSPLASVIERIAECCANGKLRFLDEEGDVIKNVNKNLQFNRIRKLLKRPNPLQTWDEFFSQQIVLCKIFGYCPVFCLCPAGMDKSFTKSMWNLNPVYAQPYQNTEFDIYDEESGGMVKNWRITILGKSYDFPAEDVLVIKDGYVESDTLTGLPLSKVAGLDYDISNICAGKEASNVLLKKKGPLGVFSQDSKPDISGQTPMTPKQKRVLQRDLQQYGLTAGQWQHVISKTPIKWNAISFNVEELGINNTIRGGVDSICDRYSYPAELMSGKNATYENRTSAEQYLYNNNIIPFCLRVMARYDEFFGIETAELNLDFDHLSILQDDIMKAGQARKYLSDGLTLDWQNGIITYNEYRQALKYDTIAGFDIYYNEYIKKFPPPVLKQPKNEAAPKDTSTAK